MKLTWQGYSRWVNRCNRFMSVYKYEYRGLRFCYFERVGESGMGFSFADSTATSVASGTASCTSEINIEAHEFVHQELNECWFKYDIGPIWIEVTDLIEKTFYLRWGRDIAEIQLKAAEGAAILARLERNPAFQWGNGGDLTPTRED